MIRPSICYCAISWPIPDCATAVSIQEVAREETPTSLVVVLSDHVNTMPAVWFCFQEHRLFFPTPTSAPVQSPAIRLHHNFRFFPFVIFFFSGAVTFPEAASVPGEIFDNLIHCLYTVVFARGSCLSLLSPVGSLPPSPCCSTQLRLAQSEHASSSIAGPLALLLWSASIPLYSAA